MRKLFSIVTILSIAMLVSSCDIDWFNKYLSDTLWLGEYEGYYVDVTFKNSNSGKIKIGNATWKMKYKEDDHFVTITLSSDDKPSLEGEFDNVNMYLHGINNGTSSLFPEDGVHLTISTEYDDD